MSNQPSYLSLLSSGILEMRVESLKQRLSSCDLCPRRCLVNRMVGELGYCGIGELAWVASYGPHLGEEDPLRGWRGSGTIFFSRCNLSCVFCQNADISQRLSGRPMTATELAQVMLELQTRGCHNINLVSPTHVIAQILEAMWIAAQAGLNIPIVYNSGGYDSVDTLKYLDAIIDIYMPDMKYGSDEMGGHLSGVDNYTEVNREAVLEMHRQVGDLEVDRKGIAVKGLLIRHLILPGGNAGSEEVLEFIKDQVSTDTYLNIMDQYRPTYQANQFETINRRISATEFQEVLGIANEMGFKRLD